MFKAGLPYFFMFFMLGLTLIFSHFNAVAVGLVIVAGAYLFFLNKKIAITGLLFMVAAVGYVLVAVSQHSLIPEGAKTFNGKIDSIPLFDGDTVSFTFSTQWREKVLVKRQFQTEIEKKRALQQLKVSNSCHIEGVMTVPPPPANLHAFSYPQWLHSQNIYKIIDSPTFISCSAQSLSFYDRIRQFRESQSNRILQLFSGSGGSMMNALILGNREGMSPETLQTYQMLGLTHLLAVSGLHINFIFGILYIFLVRSGITKERTALMICALLPAYIILAGEAPSVLRSGIMMIIFLGSRIIPKFHLSGYEALSLSGLIILVFHPLDILQIGFQLSYLVTFSLLISAHYLNKFQFPKPIEILMISLVAQVVTLPVLIQNFYGVSVLTPIVNLLFIPFITFIILPMSFIIYFISFLFLPISNGLFLVYQQLLSGSELFLTSLSNWSFANFQYGNENEIFLLLLASISLLLLPVWEKLKPAKAMLLLSGLFILPYMVSVGVKISDPYGYIDILNVGQGDSALIQMPHHQMNMLIDTGGTLPIKLESLAKKTKSL